MLIRPALSEEITILAGFPRAEECIAAGEEAAMEALPAIRKQLAGPRWFRWYREEEK